MDEVSDIQNVNDIIGIVVATNFVSNYDGKAGSLQHVRREFTVERVINMDMGQEISPRIPHFGHVRF